MKAVIIAFCILVGASLLIGCTTAPAVVHGADQHEVGETVFVGIFCEQGPDMDIVMEAQRVGDLEGFRDVLTDKDSKCYHTPSLRLPPVLGTYVAAVSNGCLYTGKLLLYFSFNIPGEDKLYMSWTPSGVNCTPSDGKPVSAPEPLSTEPGWTI